jgi:hypothetical protein
VRGRAAAAVRGRRRRVVQPTATIGQVLLVLRRRSIPPGRRRRVPADGGRLERAREVVTVRSLRAGWAAQRERRLRLHRRVLLLLGLVHGLRLHRHWHPLLVVLGVRLMRLMKDRGLEWGLEGGGRVGREAPGAHGAGLLRIGGLRLVVVVVWMMTRGRDDVGHQGRHAADAAASRHGRHHGPTAARHGRHHTPARERWPAT